MPELGKAYVQIIPSAEGISGKISSAIGGEATSAGTSAGKSMGGSMVSALKGIIVAAGIGTAIKESLDLGGELQQNLGGTEAVFGDFASSIQNTAQDAYKNMGLSASDYMATANKMGSLFQGSGIEQEKALSMTSEAMQRAADVASVMGIDTSMAMESIAGAAKGNFTMMDNLGVAMNATTLQAYALEKGINFDWNTADNAQKAELAMQMFMDRTSQYEGNFARESEETFSGSLGAMQAAAQDFMANLALGEDISAPLANLLSTAETFIIGNLAPMVGNILAQLPMILETGFSAVISALDLVSANAETLVQQGLGLLTSLVTGIITNLPLLAEAALNVVTSFGSALLTADWAGIGNQIMTALKTALGGSSGSLLENGVQMIQNILDGITSALPNILSIGVEVISNVANGILSNLPQLITTAGELLTSFASFVLQNLPTIWDAGVELLLNLVDGIISNLPEIANAALTAILEFDTTILRMLPDILAKGIEILAKLVEGIIQAIPKLVAAIPEIFARFKETIMSFDWMGLGSDILDGIGTGITNSVQTLINVLWGGIDSAIKWIQSKLTIGSPSKYMADNVGKWMALGIGEGFDDNIPETEMADVVKDTALSMDASLDSGLNASANGISYEAIYQAVKEGAEAANLVIDVDGRELTRRLKGLGVALA